ncbi:MAG: IS110 family transposase [Deltaproteobacteria bacterium]|nr:IS110 family transposase [Deltaproteobacteria bacterium]
MRLTTLPGVSRIAIMIILAELVSSVSNFRSAKALSSWAGLSPGNNESAG